MKSIAMDEIPKKQRSGKKKKKVHVWNLGKALALYNTVLLIA